MIVWKCLRAAMHCALFAFFALIWIGLAHPGKGADALMLDAYFNDVTRQLLEIPATSEEKIETVLAGGQVDNPPEAEDALIAAAGWLREPFNERFAAPADAPLIAFLMEGGCCDVVRSRYHRDGYRFDTAQSRYVLSVTVRGLETGAEESPERHANNVARMLFKMSDRINLIGLETWEDLMVGKQEVAPEHRVDPDWPQWHDSIHWWYSPGVLGYLMVKSAGGPTREVIAPFAEMNRRWFTR